MSSKNDTLLSEKSNETDNAPQTADAPEIYAFPVSHAQQQLWFLNRMNPDSPAYNIPFAFRLKGRLAVSALERSINEIIQRHETFRTTFALDNGNLTQFISSRSQLTLELIDLSNVPDRDKQCRMQIDRFAVHQFNLEKGPLVKAALIVLGHDEHMLLLNFHHIILDHLSVWAFTKELTACYEAFSGGQPPGLPQPPIQYADVVIWQKQEKQVAAIHEKLDYWRKTLKDQIQFLELPIDKPRPARQSFRGFEKKVKLPKQLSDDVRSLCRKEKKSLFVFLLSAFKILLYKYTGKTEITVGCPFANRNQPGLDDVMGCCMNTLPLRTIFSPEDSFYTILDKVREVTFAAQANQEVSFEQIVETVHPLRDGSFNPLFQVTFMFQDPPMNLYLKGIECESLCIHNSTAKFDFTLWMWDAADGISGLWEFNTDLFEPQTIERMFDNYATLIRGIVDKPELKVSELSVLSDTEKMTVLDVWNRTGQEYPKDRCLHSIFEAAVKRTPDKIAVESDGDKISYSVLNEKANTLAHYLRKSGIVADTPVGIYIERSINMVIGLLGIMKAGGAYVPLDPSFPHDRLEYMLEDTGITILLTQQKLAGRFKGFQGKEICLDRDWGKIDGNNGSNPVVKTTSKSLVYIIYTSGSTGKPKGVQIEHYSLVNFLYSMLKEPGLLEKDILLSVTTLSFDIAGLELFLPLVAGATIVLANKEQAADGKELLNLISVKGITVLQATPATWRLMIAAGWNKKTGIKILCGGEALARDLANELIEREGSLWNMYGPTETTVWSAVKRIDAMEGPVLIGRPIANTQFYILDNYNKPVPIGVAGELHIGGDGLARGYWNRPELTAERFITISPDNKCAKRLYKTGDLVRWRPDGCIEFLGRLDNQVKVRGFRIELGEIESVLARHPHIKQVVVSLYRPTTSDVRIVAYIIPKSESTVSASELRDYLKKSLPDYMIPSYFQFIEQFPLTPNGKIDKKALPEPETTKSDTAYGYVAPRDDIELRMTEIWEKTLGKKQVGITDNFFELGGHSLLAAQLFAKIEQMLGVSIPLAVLFQAQTIESLSKIIKQKDWKPSWTCLVPIKSGGAKPPLFLVHGAEGNVLLYRELAHQLDEDQPVYGLQSKGIDGKEDPNTRFEDMARDYLKEMTSVQSQGPYYLGGYCLGGVIAYEMAQQLTARGEKVVLLAMFESYNVQAIPKDFPRYFKFYHTIQNVFFHFENLVSIKSGSKYSFFKEKLDTEISRIKVRTDVTLSNIKKRLHFKADRTYHHVLISKVNDTALEAYVPREFNGHLVLFKPKRNFAGLTDTSYGWRNLVKGDITIHDLPVNPRGMLVEPFVRLLSARLQSEINKIPTR